MAKKMRSNNPGDAANAFVRVLLSDAGELAGGLDAKQWDETLEFFGCRCAYTGKSVTKASAVQEHAIPINRDHCGLHLYGNVVPATEEANRKKGNKHYRDFINDPAAEKLGFNSARLQKIEDFMAEKRYCEKAKPFQGLPEYCQSQYEVIKALCKINQDYLRGLSSEAVDKQAHDNVTKSVTEQGQNRLGRGCITQEAVLAMIPSEVDMGLQRGEIIEVLGVKGDRSGEIAVDNRLRNSKSKAESYMKSTGTASRSRVADGTPSYHLIIVVHGDAAHPRQFPQQILSVRLHLAYRVFADVERDLQPSPALFEPRLYRAYSHVVEVGADPQPSPRFLLITD